MPKFSTGVFTPKNPQKYIGKGKIQWRSSWELVFMQFLDNNDNILHWASESIRIPYKHPLTGKLSTYVPDFFVVYKNKTGKTLAEIVEIKPKKQSVIESKVASAKNKMVVAVNHAKWAACSAYCKANGLGFRIVTEDDLFYNGRK
jgi:hypothetical protein